VRALCVLHDHVSSSGYVGERLRELGWDVQELVVVPADAFNRPDVHCEFPSINEFDLLIPMGAPWSAYDDAHIGRWLSNELQWLAEAVAADVPVLGICFGAQALARALGGNVGPAANPEIGWVHIDTDEPALVPAGPWFQWHYDEFSIPPGAVEIARSAGSPQAFRIGRCLAVQFHPELTPAGLAQWLANGGEKKAQAVGVDPQTLRTATGATEPQARARAAALIDIYLGQVMSQT